MVRKGETIVGLIGRNLVDYLKISNKDSIAQKKKKKFSKQILSLLTEDDVICYTFVNSAFDPLHGRTDIFSSKNLSSNLEKNLFEDNEGIAFKALKNLVNNGYLKFQGYSMNNFEECRDYYFSLPSESGIPASRILSSLQTALDSLDY